MADGQVFIGKQAVDAGLIDGIKTLDRVLAEINAAGGVGNGGGAATGMRGRYSAGATAASSGSATAPPAASTDYADLFTRAKALQSELSSIGLRITRSEAETVAGGVVSSEPTNIALYARIYVAREAANGRRVSPTDAIDHVMRERGHG